MPEPTLITPKLDGFDLVDARQDLPNPYARVVRCDLQAGVRNGEAELSEVPTVVIELPGRDWTVHWFSSDWGDEFTPHQHRADEPLQLRVSTGRSSKGLHPWACLEHDDGSAVVVSPAWSGNWRIDLEPTADGVRVLAGISPWEFRRTLRPGRPFVAPSVYVAWAATRSDATAGLAAAASRWVVPRSASVPLTWNHWWPYEDAEISADAFLRDVGVARELGYDLAVLDAGWFGPADPSSFWEKLRGDWDDENTVRFPEGVAGLAEAIRAAGVDFGIWCEIEALGDDARVAQAKPEIVARRDEPGFAGPRADDPGWLGYVCLGAPAARTHVLDTLERLIGRTGARWLKVDFNLDPGPGCSRTDHGHDAGDGLYEHYRGLYAVLAELRSRHPALIVEDCSSGGLRLDLGLLSQVHCGFLSDPDWTEFQLQLLWGASQLLPAASIYHFSESQWRGFHAFQNLDPASIGEAEFDASLRAVMLHRFALSLRLHELSPTQRQRVREHAEVYREHVVPALRDHGVIRALTPQPRREGGGERWPAFQLSAGERQLVLAIALPGAGRSQVICPLDLRPEVSYRLRVAGPGGDPEDLSDSSGLGADLMWRGFELGRQSGATSWLVLIEPVAANV